MKLKSISFPMLLFTGILLGSCGNEASEKNEGVESKYDEAAENRTTIEENTKTLRAGEISVDKLPAGIKEFIYKNYTGYAIINAASDPLCQGGDAIDVAVTKSGAPNLSLIFKPEGAFVQQEEDVDITTAPDKVRDVITAKYADYKAGDQIEKLILADKTVQYLVDLSKGTYTKEVIFSINGVVVCEK